MTEVAPGACCWKYDWGIALAHARDLAKVWNRRAKVYRFDLYSGAHVWAVALHDVNDR